MNPIAVVDERSPVWDIGLSPSSLHTPSSLVQENAQAFLTCRNSKDRTATAFLRYEAPFPKKLRENTPPCFSPSPPIHFTHPPAAQKIFPLNRAEKAEAMPRGDHA